MDQKYIDDVQKYDSNVDMELLEALYKPLAGSLAQADAANVAFSDADELTTVKKNFIQEKLGVMDEAAADEALTKVGEMMADDNSKNRLTVYYLLTTHFDAKAKVCN